MLRSARLVTAAAAACEPLERRTLLCALPHPNPATSDVAPQYVPPDGAESLVDTGGIVWANRTTTDNFAAAYGAQAAAARNVVDAAFHFWNRVFPNLNQDGGNSQIDITVTAMARGTGWGGSGGVDTLIGNKPRTSSISLGGGGDADSNGTVDDAEGYYIDPTPYDYSEFQGAIINAFVGEAPLATPARTGNDLFSLVTIELQHALGIDDRYMNLAWRQDPNDYIRPAGASHAQAANDSEDTPGKLYTFDAPGVRALFTSNNGGAGGEDRGYAVHTARPSQSYTTGGITYTGLADTGTTGYATGQRYLPSRTSAVALMRIYGYSFNPPETVNGTFYTVPDPANRRIIARNSALNSNDVFQVRMSGTGDIHVTVDIGSDVAGTNMDSAWLSVFSRLAFDSVVVNAGSGNDTLRVDDNQTLRVTLNGDSGDDLLEVSFNQKNLGLIVGNNIALNGGIDNDTIAIYDNNTSLGRTLDLTSASIAIAGGASISYGTVEAMSYTGGSGIDTLRVASLTAALTVNGGLGNDVVNLGNTGFDFASISGAVTFNGSSGNDTFNVGAGNADVLVANAVFDGGIGVNNLVINDTSLQYPASYDVGPSTIVRQGFFTPRHISYVGVNTSEIIIRCGSDHDTVIRRVGVSPLLRAFGNAGDDNFTEAVFNPTSTSAYDGGTGSNSITLDGTSETVGRTWDIYTNRVTFQGAINYGTVGFTTVAVLAGSGNDAFWFANALFTQAIVADGGEGNDSFNTNGARIPSLTVRGGTGGFDTLGVDDRSLAANLDSADLYPTSYVRYREPAFPGDPGEYYTVAYGGFESITAWRRPAQVVVNVYGTSPDVLSTHSTVLNGDTSDSVINIHARDAAGNLTLAGNLTVNAGGTTATDRVFIHAAGSQPGNYRFYNRFANSVASVDGLGVGYLTIDNLFDSITFNAGSGDDTFALDSYRSGNALAINGGGGDDTMNIVPTGKDLFAITSFASFNFDGGPGSDTMTVTNENSPSGYGYFVNNSGISTIRIAGGQAQLGFGASSTEAMIVRGSQQVDTYQLWLTDPGQRVDLLGLNGNDTYTFGGLIGTTLQLFRGPIFIDGGGGQDTIQLRDEEITSARTFHIAADSVGAFAGDNLFGVGGTLRFANITGTLSFNGGPGAETVYVAPHPTAAITLNGNNPTAAPGDRLFLGLAAAQNVSINGTAAAGSVTSSNLRTLNYNGFETGPTIDAVAPAVVDADINVDGAGFALAAGAAQQSIDVSFSENVSGLISPASLLLQNLTTGQAIPTTNVAVSYVAATNTARFTFPGYPHGVLPDGDYQGTVLAGLPDFFGNALPADVDFSFFFLNGDANRDRTVGIADFSILAANFNQPGAFSDGDFNYSGTVEIGDFSILASKFNTTLPAPAGAARGFAGATTRPWSAPAASLFASGRLLEVLDEFPA